MIYQILLCWLQCHFAFFIVCQHSYHLILVQCVRHTTVLTMETKISHEVLNIRMTTMLDTHTHTRAFLSESSFFLIWLKEANAKIKP